MNSWSVRIALPLWWSTTPKWHQSFKSILTSINTMHHSSKTSYNPSLSNPTWNSNTLAHMVIRVKIVLAQTNKPTKREKRRSVHLSSFNSKLTSSTWHNALLRARLMMVLFHQNSITSSQADGITIEERKSALSFPYTVTKLITKTITTRSLTSSITIWSAWTRQISTPWTNNDQIKSPTTGIEVGRPCLTRLTNRQIKAWDNRAKAKQTTLLESKRTFYFSTQKTLSTLNSTKILQRPPKKYRYQLKSSKMRGTTC